jgi:hypothetical protein
LELEVPDFLKLTSQIPSHLIWKLTQGNIFYSRHIYTRERRVYNLISASCALINERTILHKTDSRQMYYPSSNIFKDNTIFFTIPKLITILQPKMSFE